MPIGTALITPLSAGPGLGHAVSMNPGFTARRLCNQQIGGHQIASVPQLVERMGAIQAQDYAGGLWAIGLRLAGSSLDDVEAAIANRSIVRTWPMRGTLHFVPAIDARWMVRLLAPRVIARSAARYRQLELDRATLQRGRRVLVRELEGGRRLTRPAAYAALASGGVSPEGQRGIHILSYLAHEGLLCLGPREGRQPTFVLLEEWVQVSRNPGRDEALATLAARYFRSHGPATLQDFAWWSGLTATEARQAVQLAGRELHVEKSGGREWLSADGDGPGEAPRRFAVLLPPWDEYLVAYRLREDAIDNRSLPPSGLWIGSPLVLVNGKVRGAWRRRLGGSGVKIAVAPWRRITQTEGEALRSAATRYGRFIGKDVEATLSAMARPRPGVRGAA